MRNWHIRCGYVQWMNTSFFSLAVSVCAANIRKLYSWSLHFGTQEWVWIAVHSVEPLLPDAFARLSAALRNVIHQCPYISRNLGGATLRSTSKYHLVFQRCTTLQAHVTALQCDIYIFGWSHRVSFVWNKSAATQCKEPHHPVACTVMPRW